jgi:hypothetical protein
VESSVAAPPIDTIADEEEDSDDEKFRPASKSSGREKEKEKEATQSQERAQAKEEEKGEIANATASGTHRCVAGTVAPYVESPSDKAPR